MISIQQPMVTVDAKTLGQATNRERERASGPAKNRMLPAEVGSGRVEEDLRLQVTVSAVKDNRILRQIGTHCLFIYLDHCTGGLHRSVLSRTVQLTRRRCRDQNLGLRVKTEPAVEVVTRNHATGRVQHVAMC